jgi:hypothetical protein
MMKISELRVGDEFLVLPTRRSSSFGGTIVKINRVNIVYEYTYQPNPLGPVFKGTLQAPKAQLAGGSVAREGMIYPIEE